MPNRIPTPGISTPAVRKSSSAIPSAKPSMPSKAQVNKSETILKQKVQSGKVTDLNKTREQIAKKTGSWPNGYTN